MKNKNETVFPAIYQQYLDVSQEMPDEIAIQIERSPYKGTLITWNNLIVRADEISKRLIKYGVTKKSRCGIILGDHPDNICTFLAIWKLNAIVVLIDRSWGNQRKNTILEHAQASILIDYSETDSIIDIECKSSQNVKHTLPEDTAMLGYTSGSTGDPKGVPFTHRKLALTMQAANSAINYVRGKSVKMIACYMRLSSSGAFNLNYTWAAFSRATLVVLPELTLNTAKETWHEIEKYKIDQVFIVPTLIELVYHMSVRSKTSRITPIFITGSSPISKKTQQLFQNKYKVPLLNAYGLSETMCASFFGVLNQEGLADNSIGVPWLLSSKIVDDKGNEINGEGKGELQLYGPTVFDGYYRNDQATKESFDGGWFKTGDIASRDENGNYSIVGRIKDVVMKGGHSIYLNEIEEAAINIKNVIEATAIPIVRGEGNEDIGLIVRLNQSESNTLKNILHLIKEDVGPSRAPYRIIETFFELPRTGQGKFNRKEANRLWEELVSKESSNIELDVIE